MWFPEGLEDTPYTFHPKFLAISKTYRVSQRKLGFFESGLRDKNMQVRYFWRVFLKS